MPRSRQSKLPPFLFWGRYMLLHYVNYRLPLETELQGECWKMAGEWMLIPPNQWTCGIIGLYIYIYIYVSGWWFQPTPLKKKTSSVRISYSNWMESHKIHVPNHQPDLAPLSCCPKSSEIGHLPIAPLWDLTRLSSDFFQDISENSGTLFRKETGDKHRIIDMSFKTHLTHMIRHFFESPGPVPRRFYLL